MTGYMTHQANLARLEDIGAEPRAAVEIATGAANAPCGGPRSAPRPSTTSEAPPVRRVRLRSGSLGQQRPYHSPDDGNRKAERLTTRDVGPAQRRRAPRPLTR
jgi:hypothetical protein